MFECFRLAFSNVQTTLSKGRQTDWQTVRNPGNKNTQANYGSEPSAWTHAHSVFCTDALIYFPLCRTASVLHTRMTKLSRWQHVWDCLNSWIELLRLSMARSLMDVNLYRVWRLWEASRAKRVRDTMIYNSVHSPIWWRKVNHTLKLEYSWIS